MQNSEKTKILIVDDDKMNGELLQKRLIKKEFLVEYVESGQACLDYLESNKVDIVLLDLMMPQMSGSQVLERIRVKFDSFKLPVIIVTAKDGTSDIVEALKGGASDYLVKPVNVDVATARINTQSNLKKLFEENLKVGQVDTINKMVTTLNHEINNPLMIAYGNLSLAQNQEDNPKIDKAVKALDRITEIVKRIEKITNGNIEEVAYSSESNMYKV